MKVDAHQSFWKYEPKEYDWIGEDQAALRRDFLPDALQREIAAAGIDAVVSVQARQSIGETAFLLDQASRHDFIRGVVGWLPLASPSLSLLSHPKLKGVRHVVQAEPDGFLLRKDFNRGIARLRAGGLVYDLLVQERQLPEVIQFVDLHPNQRFVLDHGGKPRIRDGQLDPWERHLDALGERPHVSCKVSGLVTEADPADWTDMQLRTYLDIMVDAFGPKRLMFGSDWPVCLLACSYGRWYDTVRDWAGTLSTDEQARVMGGTAVDVYRL